MSLLGERFKQERETRGIAILQIEIDTRIRANVIQAIEDGDYANLPPAPFLRGLVRSYANYLGVDPQIMVELYDTDTQPIQPAQVRPVQAPSAPPPPNIPQQPPVPMPPSTPSMLPPKPQPMVASKPSEANTIQPDEIKPAPVEASHTEEPKKIEPVQASVEPPIFVEPEFAPETAVGVIPFAPPPDLPPEMLPPPERIEHPNQSTGTELQTLVAYVMQHGLPIPVVALVILAILLSCLAVGLLIATQIGPLASFVSAAPTITSTRVPPTITRTLVPGSGPTSVPTLPVTAAPFPTFPGNPTATSAAPRRTIETVSGLNLDVDVTTDSVNLQIGVDGVLVFSGNMASGASRSWSARDTMYIRVENITNAVIKLNGKNQGPNVFAERKLLERQWTLNDRGVPILETPVPPAVMPGATPPATPGLPRVNPAPTATLTPFS